MELPLDIIKTPLGIAALALFALFWILRFTAEKKNVARLQPRWLLHLVTALAVVVFVAGALASVQSVKEGLGSVLGLAEQPARWHGFYGDIGDDGKPVDGKGKSVISTETHTLKFSRDDNSVAGTTTGPVMDGGQQKMRTWAIQGFYTADFLAFTQISRKTDNKPEISPNGVNSYYLQKSSGGYVGSILLRDCGTHANYICPYAMTTDQIGPSDARSRWPRAFEGHCEKLELDLDAPRELVCAAKIRTTGTN